MHLGKITNSICSVNADVSAAVAFETGFPAVVPGSIASEDATLCMRTLASCTVYCVAVPHSTPQPSVLQVLAGLAASGAVGQPLFLTDDFRPTSSGQVDVPAGATTVTLDMSVPPGLAAPDVDVYCSTLDANNATLTDADVLMSLIRVRFLQRKCIHTAGYLSFGPIEKYIMFSVTLAHAHSLLIINSDAMSYSVANT